MEKRLDLSIQLSQVFNLEDIDLVVWTDKKAEFLSEVSRQVQEEAELNVLWFTIILSSSLFN